MFDQFIFDLYQLQILVCHFVCVYFLFLVFILFCISMKIMEQKAFFKFVYNDPIKDWLC